MPNPYAVTTIPPIGRLLDAICAHCGVGGTIRPRNRTLADWANYASAGHITPLLDQLACDGRILYDRTTGLITRLFDPTRDQLIPRGINSEDEEENDDSALIPSRDRDLGQQDAENESIPRRDQNAPHMEDHVLVAAADHDSDSAAARYKIPCSVESIPPRDQNAARFLAEKGADEVIITDAFTVRPDLTLSQVRDTWAHFEPRIKAKRCTIGAFFKAIRRGQLHSAPPDPQRPLNPESYADDPAFKLGSDTSPPDTAQQAYHDAHWRAVGLLGPGAPFRAMAIVVERLVAGDSDDAALAALETHRKAVKR